MLSDQIKLELFVMNKNIVGVMAAMAVAFASNAFAVPVTQSTAPAGADSYWYSNGWNWQTLGSVTLATGTNSVLSLTSTASLVDQGWGGQDYNNGVKIGLFDNNNLVWYDAVAGSYHNWTTQTYTAGAATLAALDSSLATVNWADNITLQMFTTPYAWGGWELHVANASFSVTSEASSVPEPGALALCGLGIAGLAATRRRKHAAI